MQISLKRNNKLIMRCDNSKLSHTFSPIKHGSTNVRA